MQQEDPQKGIAYDDDGYGGEDAYDDDGNVILIFKDLLIRRIVVCRNCLTRDDELRVLRVKQMVKPRILAN